MTRLPTVAQLFDSGISIFKKEWKLLSSITILLLLPLQILSANINLDLKLIIPYVILLAIISPTISIITTITTEEVHNKNKKIHIKTIYKYIRDRFIPVLGTSILIAIGLMAISITLITGLGLLFTGIAYLIQDPLLIGETLSTSGLIASISIILSSIIIITGISVYLLFSIPITILKKISGIEAIKESISLVKGRWWNIFGRVLLLQFIAGLIVLIISIFGKTILGESGISLYITLMIEQILTIPISIALIVFYLEIKPIKSIKPRKKIKINKTTTKKIAKKASKK